MKEIIKLIGKLMTWFNGFLFGIAAGATALMMFYTIITSETGKRSEKHGEIMKPIRPDYYHKDKDTDNKN